MTNSTSRVSAADAAQSERYRPNAVLVVWILLEWIVTFASCAYWLVVLQAVRRPVNRVAWNSDEPERFGHDLLGALSKPCTYQR